MSTFYDALRAQFGALNATDKVAVLRHAMLPHIFVLQSYSGLLDKLDISKTDAPDEIKQIVESLSAASRATREILDALTLPYSGEQNH